MWEGDGGGWEVGGRQGGRKYTGGAGEGRKKGYMSFDTQAIDTKDISYSRYFRMIRVPKTLVRKYLEYEMSSVTIV